MAGRAYRQGADERCRDGYGVRLLGAGELPLYLGHLLRLDRRTRWLRFDHAMDDTAIQAHCLGLAARGARVLGAFVAGELRGAAELSPCRVGTRRSRELAFSVEPDFQRCGLGFHLIARALDLISPEPAVMLCRAANKGMVALAERTGAEIAPRGDDLLCTIETADRLARGRLPAPGMTGDPAMIALTRGYV